MKKIILFSITLIISSCGGGGGGDMPERNQDIVIPSTPKYTETCSLYNENTYRCIFTHEGLERYYFIQDKHPEATGTSSVLFVLHGYGSSAINIMTYSNLRNYTYTKENNFISIFPQGAPMNTDLASSSSHWNSGGWTIGSTVDDIDFIDVVLQLVSEKSNINSNRVYSTGMSNGGFMSYHLACNLSSKFAAVISVTGSMSSQTFEDCNPSHPIAIMQIHGQLDATVPLNGNNSLGMTSIEDVLNYWSSFNSCGAPITSIADYFDEGFSINHKVYKSCLNNVQVELYNISNMGHTWPGTSRYGISASDKIWSFINTYDINGKIN